MSAPADDLGSLTGMGQAELDLLPANHDGPAHEDRQFVRTARRCRTLEIQVGPHTITAADPLPGDLLHTIENDRSGR